jgi:hypothetical protein
MILIDSNVKVKTPSVQTKPVVTWPADEHRVLAFATGVIARIAANARSAIENLFMFFEPHFVVEFRLVGGTMRKLGLLDTSSV